MGKSIALILLGAALVATAGAGTKHMPLPPLLLQGRKVYIDNRTPDCPECADHAYEELSAWGRFQIVSDPKEADFVFVLKSTSEERPVSVIANTTSTGSDSSVTNGTVVSHEDYTV